MLGRFGPIFRPKLTQPFDEPLPVVREAAQCTAEIDPEQRILQIVPPGVVRSDRRMVFRQHQVEALEEQRVNLREMARMLMDGPLSGRWATLHDGRIGLADQRYDDGRSPL
jgi:hypothetical protein